MKIKDIVVTIVFSILAFFGVVIQASEPITIKQVKHLGGDMGLSSHRVYSIIQGKDNAVWISTKNGVDRYNGRKIKNYNLQEDSINYGDMAARRVQLVKGLDNEILAYDNTGSVYVYSDVYDDFVPKMDLGELYRPGMTLNRLKLTEDGRMLFCLSSGVYVKDKDDERLRQLIDGVYVNDICAVDDKYYIATRSGLYIKQDKSALESTRSMPQLSIETLFYDPERRKIMIGSFNDGLWEMDIESGTVSMSNNDVTDPIRAILRFDERYLALGIDGEGVFLYDTAQKDVRPLINTDDRNDFVLKGNGIYALSQDAEGNLWVGSYTGGATLVKFTPIASKALVHEKFNPNSLSDNNVNAICQLKNGDIWYATDMGVSICRENGLWKNVLRDHVCVSLCPLWDGNIAVGTYGDGIYVLDTNGDVRRTYNRQNSELTSNNVFAIAADDQQDIWVGGVDGNLVCLDCNWKKKQEYPIIPVFSISSVDSDRVAASTVDGFYIIDKNTASFSPYATFEEQSGLNMSAYIIPMLFNGDGTVWLGTAGGGLNLYDIPSRKMLKGYKMTEGLPSNDILSLLKDENGGLWIGTDKGVAILKDNDKVISVSRHVVDEKECNKLACVILSNGDVVFGSTDGIISYSPSEINQSDFEAPLVITNFSIEGMKPEESRAMAPTIHKGLTDGRIRLSHDDNSFVVNFESINLKNQDDINYKYYLENFEEDWNETLLGEAVYKKLNPGRYKLHLASVHRSNGSIIDERIVEIDIKEPWFNTWWAWMIYLIVICLAVIWAIRHKLDRMQKRYYKEKIQFFINTAHDIRTPVTLAVAPLEEAKNDESLSQEVSYLINTAYRNVKKLNAITSQLLDFEKFDSDSYDKKWETVDMCQALAQEASCFEDTCRRKDIELQLDLSSEPSCVKGDPNLLEHILDNLISNACKYTNAGGKIKLGCHIVKSNVVVTISDSGIGIPKGERKYIFSDIHRGANARKTQEIGTGFGLLQVKRLVEMLKGEVTFESIENEGTVFTLTFKRTQDNANDLYRINPTNVVVDEILASLPDANSPQGDKGDKDKEATILVVEDNDDMRQYLGRMLGTRYNVVLKTTADEARDQVKSLYPDLILSDVMMPGMQGDDFCDMVKSDPDTAGIPIILLTAKGGHESVVEGLKKGADDYLTKPFSMEILMLKVKGILENRARLRDYLLRRSVSQVLAPLGHPVSSESSDEVIQKQNDPTVTQDVQTPLQDVQTPLQDVQTKMLNNFAPEQDVQNIDVGILSESDKRFVERATSMVMANISDSEFSIDQLCREMAMSRTLFYNRLKSLTGKAPQEFIRLLRLERAAQMLRTGANVNDVAEAAGFGNVKYFSTLFKKHFGVQPSKFERSDS